ncbi:hypothetical protein H4R35_002152 [Dimargaris xerosporica]|nr:hypothetical protein H4R35_002152 [Dimargaris xerosporica]
MRLLTHNMLQCHVKGCNDPNLSFPLQLKDVELEQVETEQNGDLLANLLKKIDWNALLMTATELGLASLPETIPDDPDSDEAFMTKLHEVLMEVVRLYHD